MAKPLALAPLAAALLLSGCVSQSVIRSVRPDGGEARVFSKPYDIVYSAASRVMYLNNENIREAIPDKGRIIAWSIFQIPRAIFIQRLPFGRTRVELSKSLSGRLISGYPGGPKKFFEALKEQFVVFEKSKVAKEERARKERLERTGGIAGKTPKITPRRPVRFR